MDKHSVIPEIKTLGIDLGKNTIHLHGVNVRGEAVYRKALTRSRLVEFLIRLKPCLIGMEACGGSHHWARRIMALGHTVRLVAPQFVKPYVKSNKNDLVDAEAICEAVQRPNMRFVAVKSVAQQDLQSLHRVRGLAVAERTAKLNQIRGLLMEYGVVLPRGPSHVRRQLPEVLADEGNELTAWMRELLRHLLEVVAGLDERIGEYDATLAAISREDEDCRLLASIPGVGPLTATALVASVGDVGAFRNGRELAAWLGLVPRQHSTGGKTRLLGISKRGDSYLRQLLVHGARAALRSAGKKADRRSQWVMDLATRRGFNVAVVALANKNARTAWALLSHRERFHPMAAAA